MNRALRLQGALFIVIAGICVAASAFLPRIPPEAEVFVVGALIVLLGVPHGALDSVFARERFSIRTRRAWLGFAMGYVGIMALVVLLWMIAPSLFLVGFLIISALHFSGDPVTGTHIVTRLVQGGAVLVLPALRHGDELTRLFGLLVGAAAANTITPVLRAAAFPWAGAVVVCAVMTFRNSRQTAIELLAVGTLACFAPPLLGFALFFCAMHSARHVLRTVTYAQAAQRRLVVTAVFAPLIGVACLGGIAWALSGSIPLETRVMQLIFVGLASVTVPHLALVEPIRLEGWRDA